MRLVYGISSFVEIFSILRNNSCHMKYILSGDAIVTNQCGVRGWLRVLCSFDEHVKQRYGRTTRSVMTSEHRGKTWFYFRYALIDIIKWSDCASLSLLYSRTWYNEGTRVRLVIIWQGTTTIWEKGDGIIGPEAADIVNRVPRFETIVDFCKQGVHIMITTSSLLL